MVYIGSAFSIKLFSDIKDHDIRQTKATCCGNEHSMYATSERKAMALPKEITPTAWRKPLLTIQKPLKSPRKSEGMRKAWLTTVVTITSILMRAKAEDLASYFYQHPQLFVTY